MTGILIVSFAGLMLLFVAWLLIHQRRRRRRLGDAAAPMPASPRAMTAFTWIPRLSTIPLAVIVYLAVQSSTHRWLIAFIATAAFLVVTLSFFAFLASAQRRRRHNSISPGPVV